MDGAPFAGTFLVWLGLFCPELVLVALEAPNWNMPVEGAAASVFGVVSLGFALVSLLVPNENEAAAGAGSFLAASF